MWRANARVGVPCQSPPTGVMEMCEMLLVVTILGTKGAIYPAMYGAPCLKKAELEPMNWKNREAASRRFSAKPFDS